MLCSRKVLIVEGTVHISDTSGRDGDVYTRYYLIAVKEEGVATIYNEEKAQK